MDFDKLYEEFNEFCGNHSNCKECFNRYKWEDNDASGCFKEFLKAKVKNG